jgi:hypothetical protein
MLLRLFCFSVCAAIAAPLPKATDVLIIGGSSSGVGAAIGAARLGVSVVLVEDTPVLGGMLSNGICNIDAYSYESLSGVFEEFRLAVKEHYARTRATDPFFTSKPRNIRHADGRSFAAHEPSEGGRWEPHVAAAIFRQMAARHKNLQVVYRAWPTGVIMTGRRITGVHIQTAEGERGTILAKAVVDATHEGDIAASAGAPYRVGREPRSRLEPHAGEIYFYNGTNEILPGSSGRGDRAIPSSGLRVTVKKYPPEAGDAHLLKTPPPGYDPAEFRLSPKGLSTAVPNDKFEMNVNPVGNELQKVNWSWPEGDRAERLRLYDLHRNRALSYLYYLQHELGRKEYGLPNDEFPDNGNVPYRVFVREARRIEGDQMLTEADVNPFLQGTGWIPKLRPDSVGIGEYPIDAKPVTPKTDASKPDKGEGDFYLIDVSTAFQVPLGSLLPKHVDGLLVPTALSATHVAFSAIRMDPTWTVLGQSAGVAAALSVKGGLLPRALPVSALQDELLKQKVRLMFFHDLALTHPAFVALQRLAVGGVMAGFPDRTIRPDEPLTRAQAAVLLNRYFDRWPSVSGHHFTDVPHTHWAFRDVETLHDSGLLSVFGLPALWPEAGGYQGPRHAGFARPESRRQFNPNEPVTAAQWRQLLAGYGARTELLTPQTGHLNRAAAALDLYALKGKE